MSSFPDIFIRNDRIADNKRPSRHLLVSTAKKPVDNRGKKETRRVGFSLKAAVIVIKGWGGAGDFRYIRRSA